MNSLVSCCFCSLGCQIYIYILIYNLYNEPVFIDDGGGYVYTASQNDMAD